jgi:predicted ATPase
LQTKDLLLLLDNFEHVSKAAPVVSELLASAPSLVVLVTSRAPLHIYAEHTYAVPPMTIPHPLSLPSIDRLAEAEAVQLFVQRARQVRPDFALDTENAEAVAKICERLDGLPLAIELAAARVRLFAPQAIASHLGNSFAFLAGGPRDLPARQRTLRATIEWSYDLLDEGARQLFRRLAVFAGGFTLAAAQAVALDAPSSSAGSSSGLAPSPPGPPIAVLEPIESLVDQHLIQVSDVGGEPRFTMLEMIREYALEQLVESGETKATQQRHAGYFLALAENAEPALYGPKVAEWMDRLEVEYDNMRVALAWSIDSNSEVALRLAGALGRFWSSRGPMAEGRDWLAAALAAGASGGPDLDRWRAKALDGAGDLARILGDHGAARALFSESVTLCRKVGEVRDLAWSLGSLGNLLTGHSPDEARLLLEEAMVLFRQVDDIVGLAMVSLASSTIFLREGEYEKASASVEKGLTLAQEGGVIVALDWANNVLGRIACRQGNYAAARASFEESLAFGRQVRDRASGGVRLCDIGFTWYLEGHYAQAKRHYEEGLQIHRQVGVRTRVAETLARLGYVALRQGCWQEAQARLSESLALCQEVRPAYESGVAACLIGYAALAEVQAQLEQAARLLGAAETLQRPSEYLRSDPYPVEYEHVASALHSQLDKVTLDAAWNEGRAMTLEQAVACALEQGIAS